MAEEIIMAITQPALVVLVSILIYRLTHIQQHFSHEILSLKAADIEIHRRLDAHLQQSAMHGVRE